jgi:hypothetical protein
MLIALEVLIVPKESWCDKEKFKSGREDIRAILIVFCRERFQ